MMKEYYDKKKQDAVCTLTDILGYEVENTKSGVTAALALALRDGTARIAAIADRAANLWFWADNETCEEEYKNSVAWTEDKHEEAVAEDASHVDEAKEEHVAEEHHDVQATAEAVKAPAAAKPVSA